MAKMTIRTITQTTTKIRTSNTPEIARRRKHYWTSETIINALDTKKITVYIAPKNINHPAPPPRYTSLKLRSHRMRRRTVLRSVCISASA